MKTVIGKAMIDGRRVFVRDYMSTESVPAGMACYKEGNIMNVRFLEAVVSGKNVAVTGDFEPTYNLREGVTNKIICCDANTTLVQIYLKNLEKIAAAAEKRLYDAKKNIHI